MNNSTLKDILYSDRKKNQKTGASRKANRELVILYAISKGFCFILHVNY